MTSIRFKSIIVFILLIMDIFAVQSASSQASSQLIPAKDEPLLRISTPAYTEPDADDDAGTFRFPESLRYIGEEAFEGTAVQKIRLPEAIVAVQERAFAYAASLQFIYIPRQIKHIGEGVLLGTKHVTLSTVPEGGIKERFAERQQPRSALEVRLSTDYLSRSLISANSLNTSALIAEDTQNNGAPFTSNARTTGELKASRYKGRAALHIQDRYFP